MSNNIDFSKFSQVHSFSMWALSNVTDWKDTNDAKTSEVTKTAKLITTEIVTALLIPVATIEFIVQAMISLIVKTVHFCIPEKKSEWFSKNVYGPTVNGTLFSFLTIPFAAMCLVNNVAEDKTCEKVMENVASKIGENFAEVAPFINAHFDNVCKKDVM